MKYKHDEVIRAWLDGKTVQWLSGSNEWEDLMPTKSAGLLPGFSSYMEYRIKPEPKPDVVRYVNVYPQGIGTDWTRDELDEVCNHKRRAGIIKYTIDGETGKLKSAEVV